MDTLPISKLAPLQHDSAPLRNMIISSLRRAIETGVLKPGTRLVERDLCTQLNVSRTSLREALRQLQSEGVLIPTSSRGLAVVQVTAEDATNIYRIRAVLEALIVEQFVDRATDSEIVALIRDSEDLKAAYRSGDPERILSGKRAFYDRIAKGAHNEIAFNMLTRLTLLTSPLRRKSVARKQRQKQSIAEIENLIRAIAQRDIAKARCAAETHALNSGKSAFKANGLPTEIQLGAVNGENVLTG